MNFNAGSRDLCSADIAVDKQCSKYKQEGQSPFLKGLEGLQHKAQIRVARVLHRGHIVERQLWKGSN